jgi:hypothetical protein
MSLVAARHQPPDTGSLKEEHIVFRADISKLPKRYAGFLCLARNDG